MPGLPGAATTSSARRASAQRPHERVLPPARTDDEDPHALRAHAARGSTTVWARAGPTPTNDIGTPTISSTKRT